MFLICALLCVISSSYRPALAAVDFISYNAEGENPLSRIAVEGGTGELYVGGKNILLHLSSDLKLMQSAYVGPVEESYGEGCPGPLYKDSNCNLRPADNIVSILLLYPHNKMLVCGTARQGLCSVYAKHNFSDKFTLPSITEEGLNEDSLLGSYKGNNVLITLVDEGADSFYEKNIHYVAKAFERKPNSFHSHVFSVLSLQKNMKGYFFKDVKGLSSGEGQAYLDLSKSLEDAFVMDMVFTFEVGEYIYFVFNRNLTTDSTVLQGRIARATKNCSITTFQTYMEIPVLCNSAESHHSSQIALAGHLHTTPNGQHVLFLAFYDQMSDGSSICAYTTESIHRRFSSNELECRLKQDVVIQAVWTSHHTQEKCSEHSDGNGWPRCGLSVFRGLESTAWPVPGKRMYKIKGKKVENIYVSRLSREQTPVMVLGMADGFLHKVLISKYYNTSEQSRLYATFDVSGRSRSMPIEKSYGVDAGQQNLYLLTGTKITKVSLFSCAIHTDCELCVTSLDPLGCGWCGNQCTVARDCVAFPLHHSCPPEIHKILPQNGTTEGGTTVTIYGRYFDTGQAPHTYLGDAICVRKSHNTSSITCETLPTNVTSNVSVVVEVRSDTDVLTSLFRDVEFDFLVPKLDNFQPKHAPRSGHSTLTIRGQNLDIGSSLEIFVSDSESRCNLKSKENNTIECHLTRWTSTNNANDQSAKTSCLGSGPVIVHIDGTTLSSNENFCYMEDPVINSITPLDTIVRGGRILTVSGQHFDAISTSELKVVVGDNQSFTGTCKVINTTQLECTYPDVRSVLSVTNRGVLLLLLDGGIPLDKAEQRIMVYNDPVFYRVTQNGSIHNGDKTFVIKGQYLDMVFRLDDFSVTIGGVKCPVTLLQMDKLECDMSSILRQLAVNKDNVYPVTVTVGPITEELGDLTIAAHTTIANGTSPEYQNWLWSGIVFVLLFIICFVCIILKSKRTRTCRKKRRNNNNPDLEGQMTFQNLMRIETDEPSSVVPNNYTNIGGEDGAVGGEPCKQYVDVGTLQILEKQNLLVSRDNIILGETVGHGQFGCVYKGYLSKPGQKGEQLVAIKTILKSSSQEANIGDFLNEALIMRDFNHTNVLALIGVCVDKGEFPLVILPFMENGDLLSFIRDERNMPLVKDLVIFGLDISKGMDYLSGIKFVHRDLAARNCMLDDQFIAKVADFGLSRDIYSSHYYSSDNKKKLPVKWMAPESLEKGKYTSKSDVWSFGVVLWELITRGVNPYAAVDNWDMYPYLQNGRRLPKPQFCPPRLYQMLLSCWEFNPSRRPTFRDLAKEIKRLLKEGENEENSICDIVVDLESASSLPG